MPEILYFFLELCSFYHISDRCSCIIFNHLFNYKNQILFRLVAEDAFNLIICNSLAADTWISDFAAARNFAFSKCSGDYIYSADADELIDAENALKFKALMEVMEPEVEIVQMWYVNRHEYQTTENFEKDLRPKLFKRQRNFVWIDPIHESVRLEPVVFDSEIEIQHWPEGGHSSRDFGVFRKTIKEGKTLSKKLLHMYAMELFLSGQAQDFTDAAPAFRNMIYEEQRGADERMDCYCVLFIAL